MPVDFTAAARAAAAAAAAAAARKAAEEAARRAAEAAAKAAQAAAQKAAQEEAAREAARARAQAEAMAAAAVAAQQQAAQDAARAVAQAEAMRAAQAAAQQQAAQDAARAQAQVEAMNGAAQAAAQQQAAQEAARAAAQVAAMNGAAQAAAQQQAAQDAARAQAQAEAMNGAAAAAQQQAARDAAIAQAQSQAMNGAAQAAAQVQATRDATRATAQSAAMNGTISSVAAAEAARDAARAQAQSAAMKALPGVGDHLQSPSVLAHAAKALAVTGATAALEQVKSTLPSFLARALPLSPEVRAANAERRLSNATTSFQQAVAEKPALEATAALNASLKTLRPEQRGQFLESAAPEVAKLTEKVTRLGKDDTAKAVKDFAKAAELAGPLQVSAVTGPLAKAIADGKLEQTGKSAHGGVGGVFKNANRHNSEREFVDGLAKLEGGQLFKDALAADLAAISRTASGGRADRAAGFAAAVVNGDASQVPDQGVWNSVRTLPAEVSAKLESAEARLGELRVSASNAAVEKSLNISGGLEKLKAGDTLRIAGDVEVSAAVTVEGTGGIEARRNADGSYSVKGSATVVGGLGALDNKLAVGGRRHACVARMHGVEASGTKLERGSTRQPLIEQ